MGESTARIIDELLNKVLVEIEVSHDKNIIYLITDNNDIFKMYHKQSCCEKVYIDQIDGDLNDLIGSKIVMAEEVTNSSDIARGTCTWTFYKFATTKGYVTLKWYGSSNGCYSEEVQIEPLDWESDGGLFCELLLKEFGNSNLEFLMGKYIEEARLSEEGSSLLLICEDGSTVVVEPDRDYEMHLKSIKGELGAFQYRTISNVAQYSKVIQYESGKRWSVNYLFELEYTGEILLQFECNYDKNISPMAKVKIINE